jgi:hypothetical protein
METLQANAAKPEQQAKKAASKEMDDDGMSM